MPVRHDRSIGAGLSAFYARNCARVWLFCTMGWRMLPVIVNGSGHRGFVMKKILFVTAAFLALFSVAACTTVGKAPYGKAPVVTKG